MGIMAVNRGKRRAALVAVAAAAVAATIAGRLLFATNTSPPSAPAPVSHVDTATRACLLTSTDTDPTGTWTAMRDMARTSATNVVVQRYRLPAAVNGPAYVNTLVQLRCSTIITTGDAARSAVASRLTAGRVPHVHFVVVADRPVPGATRMSPDAVSAASVARATTR